MQIRAIIYSPIKLFAEGVAKCLQEDAQIDARPCSCLERLAHAVIHGEADVMLFDVTEETCLDAAQCIIAACGLTRAIALALPEVLDRVIACADIGFCSYVPRDASVAELCEVVMRAMREEVLCDPFVAGGLLRELQRRAAPPRATNDELAAALTPREEEVLGHLTEGLSNKEIARRLGLSAATVKNHVHSILGKTRLRNRVEMRTMPVYSMRVKLARGLVMAASTRAPRV